MKRDRKEHEKDSKQTNDVTLYLAASADFYLTNCNFVSLPTLESSIPVLWVCEDGQIKQTLICYLR